MGGCKSITSPEMVIPKELPTKGSSSLPTINGISADLSSFTFKKSHKDANTITDISIDKEALTKFAEELSLTLSSEYIAVFGVVDSTGHVFNYSYAQLNFDEDLLFDFNGAKELFIYALGDAENGVQKIAFAWIPNATEAKETFSEWVFPRYRGKVVYPNFDDPKNKNSYDVNCEWVQSVPDGYVYFGDGIGDAKYFAPTYDYECYFDNLGGGDNSSTPINNNNTGGGGTVTNWDDIFGDDEADRVHIFEIRRVPCPGNPIKFPRIAAQSGSGIAGGRFGNTRDGGTQFHGGLDILNEFNSPIFAPAKGTVVSTGFDSDLGNYVTLQFLHSDGSYYTMQFGHLQASDNMLNGSIVKAGDVIGVQGNSGNLADAIDKGYCESHSHIITRKRTTSSWNIESFSLTNPEAILTTKFNSSGTPTGETDC